HTMHRDAPSLDRAVILFDQVVQVPVRADRDAPPHRILAPQEPECPVARLVAVERDLARSATVIRLQRFSEERLSRRYPAVAPQEKVDRWPLLVDGAVQVAPLPSDL